MGQDGRGSALGQGSIPARRACGKIEGAGGRLAFVCARAGAAGASGLVRGRTKRIWITNSYCTPTDDQVEQLTKAVRRGVDVRLILPGKHDDQPLTKSAGRSAYSKLLEGGVKIFEYEPTMIHIKSMVVDGEFAMIGSSNFDARSAEINEELDVVVYDRDFGARMEEVFQRDLARCREYTLAQFRGRSLRERFTEWVALPFRSQL
ncbi:MAG: phospholipase D-like domain-containing protein [Verrucomicrobiota bacterium]|nr:phospholipase D-like domain-containing protein [Verrucomicrobiota bacterium]